MNNSNPKCIWSCIGLSLCRFSNFFHCFKANSALLLDIIYFSENLADGETERARKKQSSPKMIFRKKIFKMIIIGIFRRDSTFESIINVCMSFVFLIFRILFYNVNQNCKLFFLMQRKVAKTRIVKYL